LIVLTLLKITVAIILSGFGTKLVLGSMLANMLTQTLLAPGVDSTTGKVLERFCRRYRPSRVIHDIYSGYISVPVVA
jgi:hypothetical protein